MKKEKIILFAIILMAVGFASVTTTLILNGTLNFAKSEDFDVIFTNAKLNGVDHDEFITSDKKTINFITNELKKISDEETLTYKVANRSKNYDANVSVSCESINNEYVDITLPSETRVLAGEERTGSIIVRLIKASESDKEINLTCTLNAEAIERDTLGDEYVEPFSKAGTLGIAGSNDKSYNEITDWIVPNLPKLNISKVVFENKMNVHETEESHIYDVSENKDGSVMAYVVENEETLSDVSHVDTTQAYTLYIQSETGVKGNKNGGYLFSTFINLKTIEGLEYFDTKNIIDMSYMFKSCGNLMSIDLSSFDTSQVINMDSMFAYCQSLTSLDVSKFDTKNVTDMSDMFRYCINLASLDVSGFDTSNITNMYDMFSSCRSLTSLDVSKFDTSNVTNMGFMFDDCSKLTSLDVSKFDTSQVINMSAMFSDCDSLTNLDLSKFDTKNVTDMGFMFSRCNSLTNLDISNFDTRNVTNMGKMFNECQNLTDLDLSNFDTRNVIHMFSMFCNCKNLTNLDISGFDTSNVTSMDNMFVNCKKLSTTITIRGNISRSYPYMFDTSATEEGAQIVVNYTADASEVDAMIATKTDNSNVVKGELIV